MDRCTPSVPGCQGAGGKAAGTNGGGSDSRKPAGAFAGMLKNEAAMREMNGVLHDHGVADFNEWAQVAYSVMIAHHWKGDDKGPAAQLDKAVEQIRANKQLGEDQKKALIERIESQRGMMGLFTPHPDNIALVSQYSAQIERAIDSDRSGR